MTALEGAVAVVVVTVSFEMVAIFSPEIVLEDCIELVDTTDEDTASPSGLIASEDEPKLCLGDDNENREFELDVGNGVMCDWGTLLAPAAAAAVEATLPEEVDGLDSADGKLLTSLLPPLLPPLENGDAAGSVLEFIKSRLFVSIIYSEYCECKCCGMRIAFNSGAILSSKYLDKKKIRLKWSNKPDLITLFSKIK